MKRATILATTIIVLAVLPRIARADAGLPMIAVYLPPAWLLLVPVILIETAVGIRKYRLPPRRVLIAQSIANGLSTLVGLPLTWFVLAIVEFMFFSKAEGLNSVPTVVYAVTVQSPWLIPYERQLFWMVPIAFLVLTVLFFCMSVVIEYAVLRLFLREFPKSTIRAWTFWANVGSYAFLIVFVGISMLWPQPFNWLYRPFAPIVETLVDLVFQLAP